MILRRRTTSPDMGLPSNPRTKPWHLHRRQAVCGRISWRLVQPSSQAVASHWCPVPSTSRRRLRCGARSNRRRGRWHSLRSPQHRSCPWGGRPEVNGLHLGLQASNTTKERLHQVSQGFNTVCTSSDFSRHLMTELGRQLAQNLHQLREGKAQH
jgi:hypothetical protein